MYEKNCKIHGILDSENIIKEPNKSAKRGYTLRCRLCKTKKDRRWKFDNWEQHKKSAGVAKKRAREDYRNGLTEDKPKANVWAVEDRKKQPEKYAEISKRHRDKLGQERNTREICRRLRISVSKFHEMMEIQNSVCAICKNPETRKSRSGGICALCVDHNHETGEVRQLLCHACNQVVGHSRESIETLQSAILYLQSHEQKEIQ